MLWTGAYPFVNPSSQGHVTILDGYSYFFVCLPLYSLQSSYVDALVLYKNINKKIYIRRKSWRETWRQTEL